jgi:hypothetical protein
VPPPQAAPAAPWDELAEPPAPPAPAAKVTEPDAAPSPSTTN